MSVPTNPLSHPQERRHSQLLDRRGESRRGKYDRRRNRCAHCVHFTSPAQLGPESVEGFCQQHQVGLPPHAYSCLWLEKLPVSHSHS